VSTGPLKCKASTSEALDRFAVQPFSDRVGMAKLLIAREWAILAGENDCAPTRSSRSPAAPLRWLTSFTSLSALPEREDGGEVTLSGGPEGAVVCVGEARPDLRVRRYE
jgi:hypothetical protein